MKKFNNSDVSTRINRFLDRKAGKILDMETVSDYKSRRSYRNEAVATDTPFIALAIR